MLKIKIYDKLRNGNYNLYVYRLATRTGKTMKWEKVNHAEIIDFSKIDEDAISAREFINKCYDDRDIKGFEKFIKFIKDNNL